MAAAEAASPSLDMFDEIVMAEERWGWWGSLHRGPGTSGDRRDSSVAAGNGSA